MTAPHKSECPVAAGQNAGGSTENVVIVAPAADSGKRLATLRARAALAGVVLHAIVGDDGRPLYVLTRWHLTRELRTLDEVEAWLAQVTGGRA